MIYIASASIAAIVLGLSISNTAITGIGLSGIFSAVILKIIAVLIKTGEGETEPTTTNETEKEPCEPQKDSAEMIAFLLKSLFPDSEIKTNFVKDFWNPSHEIFLLDSGKTYLFRLEEDGITISQLDKNGIWNDLNGKIPDILAEMIVESGSWKREGNEK